MNAYPGLPTGFHSGLSGLQLPIPKYNPSL